MHALSNAWCNKRQNGTWLHFFVPRIPCCFQCGWGLTQTRALYQRRGQINCFRETLRHVHWRNAVFLCRAPGSGAASASHIAVVIVNRTQPLCKSTDDLSINPQLLVMRWSRDATRPRRCSTTLFNKIPNKKYPLIWQYLFTHAQHVAAAMTHGTAPWRRFPFSQLYVMFQQQISTYVQDIYVRNSDPQNCPEWPFSTLSSISSSLWHSKVRLHVEIKSLPKSAMVDCQRQGRSCKGHNKTDDDNDASVLSARSVIKHKTSIKPKKQLCSMREKERSAWSELCQIPTPKGTFLFFFSFFAFLQAPSTLDARREASRKNGARSHSDACCVMRCLAQAMWIELLLQQGAACPNFFRLSHGVQCGGRGLSGLRFRGGGRYFQIAWGGCP